jgi:hypothetical protein
MRDGRLQRIEAIVERQQRMPPERDDDGLLLDGKDGRLGFFGACWAIGDGLALLPLGDGLLVDPVAPGELSGSLDYFVLLDGLPPSWWRSRVKLVP